VNVWNRCASQLTGFSKEYVFGRRLVEEFVSKEYRNSVTDVLRDAMIGIETANYELQLLTSGDHVVEVLLNATTRREAQDKIIGVVGIGQDITCARRKRGADMKQRAAEAGTGAHATSPVHVYHKIRNVVGSVLALVDRATEADDLALISAFQDL
jgi:PAS domain S-box-containing protein